MASIYKQKLSKYWWVQYKDPESGQWRRKSLRVVDKQIAKNFLKKYRALEKSKHIPETESLTDLIETWTSLSAIESSPRQANHKKTNLEIFTRFAGIQHYDEISRGAIDRWMIKLSQDGLAPKTIKNKLSCVTSFCQFLADRDLIEKAPKVKPPKVERKPPRFLTEPQAAAVLAKAQEINPNLYLAVLIALKTGLRLSEIRRLDWEEFHWQTNLVVIPKTKSNRPRSIPIHTDLLVALEPIKKNRGPVFSSPRDKGKSGPYYDTWWFVNLIKPLQAAMPEIFTDGQSQKATGRAWHLFRHTFASRLVQADVDLYKVSKWLGHSSISTTEIYAHLAPRHDNDINLA